MMPLFIAMITLLLICHDAITLLPLRGHGQQPSHAAATIFAAFAADAAFALPLSYASFR